MGLVSHSLALGTLGVLLLGMAPWADEAQPHGALPPCVRVAISAPYRGFGYDHLVLIANGCQPTADCTVTTDVNPSPARVEVPRGETVEVLTWRGSPAREFQADVTCTLRP